MEAFHQNPRRPLLAEKGWACGRLIKLKQYQSPKPAQSLIRLRWSASLPDIEKAKHTLEKASFAEAIILLHATYEIHVSNNHKNERTIAEADGGFKITNTNILKKSQDGEF